MPAFLNSAILDNRIYFPHVGYVKEAKATPYFIFHLSVVRKKILRKLETVKDGATKDEIYHKCLVADLKNAFGDDIIEEVWTHTNQEPGAKAEKLGWESMPFPPELYIRKGGFLNIVCCPNKPKNDPTKVPSCSHLQPDCPRRMSSESLQLIKLAHCIGADRIFNRRKYQMISTDQVRYAVGRKFVVPGIARHNVNILPRRREGTNEDDDSSSEFDVEHAMAVEWTVIERPSSSEASPSTSQQDEPQPGPSRLRTTVASAQASTSTASGAGLEASGGTSPPMPTTNGNRATPRRILTRRQRSRTRSSSTNMAHILTAEFAPTWDLAHPRTSPPRARSTRRRHPTVPSIAPARRAPTTPVPPPRQARRKFSISMSRVWFHVRRFFIRICNPR